MPTRLENGAKKIHTVPERNCLKTSLLPLYDLTGRLSKRSETKTELFLNRAGIGSVNIGIGSVIFHSSLSPKLQNFFGGLSERKRNPLNPPFSNRAAIAHS
jgi:hypothetical protein